MVAPAIPEIIEDDDIGLAVDARTESLAGLRELGPPDLVHLTKQSIKAGASQTGVYHHVTGVDASSSASLAAYLNTLTNTTAEKTHKVVEGVYCCYNAFSHLDMRVEVKIPGSVESYCVDERGDRRVATDGLWLETFLCGILRAYYYADDGSGDTIKKIIGVRRFNPIQSTDVEHRFLDATEKLFFNGRQLGSEPEVQVPSTVSNLLTAGLLRYVNTTGRYTSAINLFEKLRERDSEVSALLAKILLDGDEEVKAVRLLHDTLQESSMDHSALDIQATFLLGKGRTDWALEIAKRSVTAAPSEFSTWARLAEVYVAREEWDLALLTLNSCPMFSYQDKDSPRMPEPSRVLLPILPESMFDEIDEGQPRQGDPYDQVHVSLRKLQAATYQGTFLKAYTLLTEIAAKIGWDALLRTRSQVFVMEEEYRSEQQNASTPRIITSKNASTVALSGTPNGDAKENGQDVSDQDDETLADDAVGVDLHASSANPVVATSQFMDKPLPTIKAEEVVAGSDPPPVPAKDPAHSSYSQFQNKRLCERWLDNLFMVLYEDLRIYTIWRTEMSQYRQQQVQYKKSAAEWEILGDLASRLHHETEALEAYHQCLNIRFSPKAMKGVLKNFEKKGDTRNTLSCLIRLITWQYRWYSEFSPDLLLSIRKLIESEGALKIRSYVQATSIPQHVMDLTHEYCQICFAFKSSESSQLGYVLGPSNTRSSPDMAAQKRITKARDLELAELQKSPPSGITVELADEANLFQWKVSMEGPSGSPYAAGTFFINLSLPSNYPFKPPTVTFTTKIYHPNISNDSPPNSGQMCLEPNPDDAVEAKIADQYRQDRPAYEKEAREWTKRFATGK
ncbi:hypothetical protein DV736_g5332, partial [Chaetothyriales sp. CBS 134916]